MAEKVAADAENDAAIAEDDARNKADLARKLGAADTHTFPNPVLAALTLIAFGYVAGDARPLGRKFLDLLKSMFARFLPKQSNAPQAPPLPAQQVARGTR